MRISTSPVTFQSKIVQKLHQVPENMRSSSLSHRSLFSSKIKNQMQNSYVSPYYNQNSVIRFISNQQSICQPKSMTNLNGNMQNSRSANENLRKLTERIQQIERRLQRQEVESKTHKKTQQQKFLLLSFQQKVYKEIQQKSLSTYENLNRQIKKVELQMLEKLQESAKKSQKLEQLNFPSQSSISKQNGIQNTFTQRKNMKLIEQKVKDEAFKIQIHLENQINKTLSSIKNTAQNNFLSILSKSKLKYKYRPLEINIKNQVSVVKVPKQKTRKQTLSTAHSSGSSEQNELQPQKKTVQIQQQKYFIDKEGYLLDQNGFYLLNEQQKVIKIDKNLIKRLKQLNMME